ncbi:lysylphosphatidylglycerol synthase domain-containing protein [Spirillospora sp. NPDC048911]|uniref:lysylphosphatidylglycerol synthase domain-containing protein n=1 Tax=Spirillospora sp. NPDC048911 TaxID=3364527 RepID=UPI003718B2EF
MSGRTRIVLSAASLLGAAALLIALPYVVGVNWRQIGIEIGHLGTVEIFLLTLLWAAGLWAYTFVLTTSLPGLTHVHAFMLNAVGSAVSNLLPFGGAAGVAVTFAMARGWGHRNAAITVSTLVTGVWNVLSRLSLPAVGVAALLIAGELPDRRTAVTASFAAAALLGVVVLLAFVLRSEAAARAVEGWTPRAGRLLLALRHRTVGVVRAGWKGLTLGMVAYLLSQALLLEGCLVAVGADVGPAEVVAVFAVNRMLTTAVITPGGAGISETSTAALLVHFAVPAAPAAAATILYSFYTYAIEMPTGGAAWAAWTLRRRRKNITSSTPNRTLVK